MTPNPKNMSADGLHDAIVTHVVALPPDVQKWVFAYLAELKRRALDGERPDFMRRK